MPSAPPTPTMLGYVSTRIIEAHAEDGKSGLITHPKEQAP